MFPSTRQTLWKWRITTLNHFVVKHTCRTYIFPLKYILTRYSRLKKWLPRETLFDLRNILNFQCTPIFIYKKHWHFLEAFPKKRNLNSFEKAFLLLWISHSSNLEGKFEKAMEVKLGKRTLCASYIRNKTLFCFQKSFASWMWVLLIKYL